MPGTRDETPAAPAERPFPDSLCWRCVHHRVVGGARSTFLKCEGLAVKYPRQPVVMCPAFTPSGEAVR